MNENFDLDPGEEPGKDTATIYEHQKDSRRRDSDGEDCPDSRQAGNEETDRRSKEHRTRASVTQERVSSISASFDKVFTTKEAAESCERNHTHVDRGALELSEDPDWEIDTPSHSARKREQHLCFFCDKIFTTKEAAESCERKHTYIAGGRKALEQFEEPDWGIDTPLHSARSPESDVDDSQPPHKKLKFDDTLTLALIRFMQQHFKAFDSKKRKNKRIYEEAASELQKIDSTVTTREVSDMWSRLTNRLEQFLAKQQTTGMGTVKPPKFFEMSFLLDRPLYTRTHHLETKDSMQGQCSSVPIQRLSC